MGSGISKEEQDAVDEFVLAAGEGDLDTVRKLLHQLNGKNETGETAMHAAASNGHVPIVRELLDQNEALELNATDNEEETPLMQAAAAGHFQVVHMLCRAGHNPEKADRMGWSTLHHACSNGHPNIVSLLLDRLSQDAVFHRDTSGCSPLWLAAYSGDAETVRLLLLHGSDPDEVNLEDVNVLEAARDGLSIRQEDSEEDLDEEQDAVMIMLKAAVVVWREERSRLGVRMEHTVDQFNLPEKVLEGTMEQPSLPLSDMGQPLLNEENQDLVEEDKDVHLVRERVIEVLKLQDPFVESYCRVQAEL